MRLVLKESVRWTPDKKQNVFPFSRTVPTRV